MHVVQYIYLQPFSIKHRKRAQYRCAAKQKEKRAEIAKPQKACRFDQAKELRRSLGKCNRCHRVGHWARKCRQKRDSSSKPSTSTASQPKSSPKESGAVYVAQEASVPAAQPEFVASVGCQQALVQQFKQRFTTQHEVSSQSMEQPAFEIFLVSSPGFAVLDSGCGKTIIGDCTLKQFQRLWQDDGRYSPKFKSETNVFKFGNGDRETTTLTVIMPVGLAGRFGTVQAAVVQGDAPLLLSRPPLKRLGATIDFHADRLQLFHGAVDLNLKPIMPQDSTSSMFWIFQRMPLTLKPMSSPSRTNHETRCPCQPKG